MDGYQPYRKKQLAWLKPWTPKVKMAGISVSDADKANGSPKIGDYIAINPANATDRWLVSAEFFLDNYEAAQ